MSAGPSSHSFAIATRASVGAAGASVSSIARVGPASDSGASARVSRPIAVASVFTADSGGGMEECPPAARAVSVIVA